MTLTNTTREIEYTMDGATLAFDFSFKAWRSSINDDIEVVFQEGETDEAALSVNSDFTLSAANNDYTTGGTVTLTTGSAFITNGKTLTIRSSQPRKQTYNLEIGGDIKPDALEEVLDRMVAMVLEAEGQNTLSQTALDSSIKANFEKILCYEGDVLTYENDILTF